MILRLISFLILLGTMPVYSVYAQEYDTPGVDENDGFYKIETESHLRWFANRVNAGNYYANAKLCNNIELDIEVNGNWTPIGGTSGYTGIFDGQGYRVAVDAVITNEEDFHEIEAFGLGFFGLFSVNNGTIQNVFCECHFTTYVEGEFLVGGIAASNSDYGTVSNCYTLVKTERYNDANVDVGAIVGENNGNVNNCYYFEGTATNGIGGDANQEGTTSKTSTQFASGEVAYLLNGSTSEGNLVWGQNITTDPKDEFPVHHNDNNTVYKICKNVDEPYSNTEPDDDVHVYNANGFCTVCGAYQEPQKVSEVYQITNAGNLYWFAEHVNSGGNNSSANAKLMNDIVVNKNVLVDGALNTDAATVNKFLTWTPMGYYNSQEDKLPYSGTFDGDNHTISGLYFDNGGANTVGLFGYVDTGSVKNVGVIDSYFNANQYVGAIIAYFTNSSSSTTAIVSNCYNTGVCQGYIYVAGLVGQCSGTTITNCYNTGSVIGNQSCGGIVGAFLSKEITNCFNYGNITVKQGKIGAIAAYTTYGEASNCYYLKGTATNGIGGSSSQDGTTSKTSDQFASGEVAYLLNGSTSEGNLVWGQNIDNGQEKQAYPVLSDARVHKGTCGTNPDVIAYTNIPGEDHAYVNGICACGAYGAYQQPEQDNNNVYQIANAGNLYWFAEYVKGGGENRSANAKLTADITVNEGVLVGGELNSDYSSFRPWEPIGNSSGKCYLGTFDGDNHTISGLYYDNATANNVGLFGYVGYVQAGYVQAGYGTVKNLGVKDSYFCGAIHVGAIVGNLYNRGEVLNCYNEDCVCSGTSYVGGIVGSAIKDPSYDNESNFTVSNCYNAGVVSGTNTGIGGIVTGIGGIVGGIEIGTVSNCYNAGDVSGTNTGIGGIVGVNYEGTVSNCYYLSGKATGGINGTDVENQAVAKTYAQFASGEVAYLLNGSTSVGDLVWGQNIDNGQEKQDYPVLSDAKVYYINGSYTNNYVSGTVFWSYENGVLTIEGAGLIPGYSENQDKPWKEHLDNINTVVVKAGITGIGTNAFNDIENLTSLFYYRSTKPENWGSNWIKSGSTVYVPATWSDDFTVAACTVTKMPTYTSTGWLGDLSNSSHVVINGELVLGQQSTSSKTTDNNNVLTVSSFGLTENGSSITIKAGEQTVGGQLIDNGGQLICQQANGEVTVEKTIYSPDWYTISSPLKGNVAATSITGLIPDDANTYAFYRYDEPSFTWQNYKYKANNFNTLDAGRGYLYARSNSEVTTLQFKGDINTKPVQYALTANGTTLSGFHLIGNPFTHNITSTNLSVSTGVTLASGYYVLSNQGSWETYLANDGEIKPGQGILIKTTAEGTLTINPTQQAAKGEQPRANSQQPMLSLNVSNGNYSDRAFVIFGKGVGLDKINHQNEEIPMLYIPMSDADYAIAMMDESVNEIPVGFESSSMGQFTITLKQENCEFEELYLLDKETGAKVNILEEGYTFMATSGDNAERFVLLKDNGQQTADNSNFAYISNNDIVIYNIKGNVQVDIYDVMGRRVYNANGSDDVHIVNTEGYSAGVYVIRIIDENGLRTQKVVIE